MKDEKLFSEFPPVSTEEWESVIQRDLKGADYERKLVWKTDEGFRVAPYYRAENLKDIDYLESLPGEFPFTRGGQVSANDWDIVQEISEEELAKANRIAVESVAKGATSVTLSVKKVNTLADMETLLHGLDLNKVGVQFHHAVAYIPVVKLFKEYVEKNNFDKNKIHGCLHFDAVVYFLKKTRFYRSQEEDMGEMLELLKLTADMPGFAVVNVNALALHNAGATLVQEMGYGLAIANEYLAFATDHGVAIDDVAGKIWLTLSVGGYYFMEIAKLRAIRLLWSTMVEQYQPKSQKTCLLHVNTVASTWNKTIYDPYVNMLRSTTEGMSAAIGGADSIALKPFDTAYKEADDFSRRISRNVQILLKEESYFNKVVDPAAGSYYVENLTNSLAEHAWKLFKEVEKAGGAIAQIADGTVKAEVEKSCQKRDMDIATRRIVLLGTNQYPNTQEKMADKVERRCDCDAPGLKSYRGAAAFEEIRLATEHFAEKSGHRPKVYLLKMGNLAMLQARAGFATNFFGCAGYEIVDAPIAATVESGVKAALEAHPDIIVVCSSDEEYATLGVEAAKLAKTQNPHCYFIVAGNPTESIEALQQAGTDDFIHVKTNLLECLKKYNQLMNVEV